MKKKIALLLAAVMTFAAIPSNIFAASSQSMTDTYQAFEDDTLITNNPDLRGQGYNNVITKSGDNELVVKIDSTYTSGDMFKLTLKNGEWLFTEDAQAGFEGIYEDSTGDNWGKKPSFDPNKGYWNSSTSRYYNDIAYTGLDRTSQRAELKTAIVAALGVLFDPVAITNGTTLYFSTSATIDTSNASTVTMSVSEFADSIVAQVLKDKLLSGGATATDERAMTDAEVKDAVDDAITALGLVDISGAATLTHVCVTTGSNVTGTEVITDLKAALTVANDSASYTLSSLLPLITSSASIPYYMWFSSVDTTVAYVQLLETVTSAQIRANTTRFPEGYAELRIPMNVYAYADEAVSVSLVTQQSASSPISNFSGLTLVYAGEEARISIASTSSARDIMNLDTIKIIERTPGQIKGGGKFTLVAPEGYQWLAPSTNSSFEMTFEPGFNPTTTSNGLDRNITFPVTGANSSNRVVYMDLDDGKGYQLIENYRIIQITLPNNINNGRNNNMAGTFYIDGLRLSPYEDDVRFGEDLKITFIEGNSYSYEATYQSANDRYVRSSTKISLGNAGVASDPVNLTVAKRVDFGISFTRSVDKIVEIYAGRHDQETNRVVFQENTPNSWWAHNATDWTFVDEDGNDISNFVKLEKVVIKDYAKLTGITKDTFTYGTNANSLTTKVFENYFRITSAPVSANSKGKIDFIMTVSVAANYSGPIYLHAAGRGVPATEAETLSDLQIANVIAPVSVTSKQTVVQVGYMTVPVEAINVKEAGAGVFEKNGYVAIRVEAYSRANNVAIDFIDPASVKLALNAGDGLLGKPVLNNATVSIPISRASSKTAMDFTVSGLKIYIDRSVPEGFYDVAVGGDAFVDNWVEGNITSNTGKFNSFGIATRYVQVGTPGLNKPLSKNVIVTPGSDQAIIDGTVSTLEMAPFIDPASNRLLIPLRFVAVALGIEDKNVLWDPVARVVTIISEERTVQFFIGSAMVKINGAETNMNEAGEAVTAVIVNDRTFIPFRQLAVAFGIDVHWDEAARQAIYNPTAEQLAGTAGTAQ